MAQALIHAVLGEDATVENITLFNGSDLVGMEYEPLFDFQKPLVNKPAWLRGGRRLRHHDRRHRHRPSWPRPSARTTPASAAKTTCPSSSWWTPSGQHGQGDALGGHVCQKTPTRSSSKTWRSAGCWSRRPDVHARLPLLLALRHAAHLLRPRHLVHPHDRGAGPADAHTTAPSTGCRTTSRKAAWATSWKTSSTGASPASATGARRCPCGCASAATRTSSARSKELRRAGPRRAASDIELHRPYIDQVTITCPKCGERDAPRRPRSSTAGTTPAPCPLPSGTIPLRTRRLFEQHFPANFISEAIDQTRGWFYTLLAISTLLFDRAPFENCVVHGPRAGRGRPEDVQAQGQRGRSLGGAGQAGRGRGALVLLRRRRALAAQAASPARLVGEMQRKFMGTLWNTYAFFALYAYIDQLRPGEPDGRSPRTVSLMDKWVLSKPAIR